MSGMGTGPRPHWECDKIAKCFGFALHSSKGVFGSDFLLFSCQTYKRDGFCSHFMDEETEAQRC